MLIETGQFVRVGCGGYSLFPSHSAADFFKHGTSVFLSTVKAQSHKHFLAWPSSPVPPSIHQNRWILFCALVNSLVGTGTFPKCSHKVGSLNLSKRIKSFIFWN